MDWKILFYITPSGQPVVQKFIDDLPEISQTRMMRNIDLLEQYGTQLGMPHARPMGSGLLELRVRGKQNVRVFYAFAKGQRIYLLHGFIKKRQTTPRHEIDIALQRKAEVEKL
jgi:phage-related protein